MIDIYSSLRVYFAAATLAAHSNSGDKGFRQKEMRFLLGLFINWMDATLKGADDSVHSNQIKRYLEELVRDGHAKRSQTGRVPRYHLTRSGLVDLVGELTKIHVGAPVEQFFLVYFFAKTYGGRISEMVESKENRLPRAFRVELEALLDTEELLNQQIRHLKIEIEKLDERIAETAGAAALAEKMQREGAGPTDMIRAVAGQFPYDLNIQKPMAELFHEIPVHLRIWELTQANRARAELLWTPLREHLANYLKQLEVLRKPGLKSA